MAYFIHMVWYLAVVRCSEQLYIYNFFSSKFYIIQVTPLVKKLGLDKDTPGNYRPISNLNNISKFLERLILQRIQLHISSSTNFNSFQLAYLGGYSTESAHLLALDNIYHSTDTGSATVVTSLDLSAAFDTIDHSILNRLQTSFSITGSALAWLKSFSVN